MNLLDKLRKRLSMTGREWTLIGKYLQTHEGDKLSPTMHAAVASLPQIPVGAEVRVTEKTDRAELDGAILAMAEALEFYANRANWTTHDDEKLFNNISDADWEKSHGHFAGGNNARIALAELSRALDKTEAG